MMRKKRIGPAFREPAGGVSRWKDFSQTHLGAAELNGSFLSRKDGA